jgi:serine/threonine protein kinase
MRGETWFDDALWPAQVDRICDRFEAHWRSGGRKPRIEEFLAGIVGAARAVLLGELLAVELELRRRAGECTTLAEYQARFPADGPLVEAAFAAPAAVSTLPGSSSRVGGRSGKPRDPLNTRAFAVVQALIAGPSMPDGGREGHELGLGCTIGPYEITGHLGQGGMGWVYRARHRSTRHEVALKVIHTYLADESGAVRRFRREFEAVRSLRHDHIVRVYEMGSVDGRCYLTMEYIEGLDLARLVRERGPLPVAEACRYLRQAALGLQHAHERGVIHRDVKPSNLILTQGSIVKVTDLGLARLAIPGRVTITLTREDTLLGTPDYMAPEQASDPHGADVRSDVYSLGCSLYYLLSGEPPYPGGTAAEKIHKHRECEPTPIEDLRVDVPAGLSRILRTLMSKRPGDRCQSSSQVALALEPYCREVITSPISGIEAQRGIEA